MIQVKTLLITFLVITFGVAGSFGLVQGSSFRQVQGQGNEKFLVNKDALRTYPDLIVKDIVLLDDCRIKVTLKNIGSAGVPDSGYDMSNGAAVQMYNNNQPWGGIRLGGIDTAGALKTPGGEVSYIWFNRKVGTEIHTIKVVVDNNNAVVESNELNNDLTVRLFCRGN